MVSRTLARRLIQLENRFSPVSDQRELRIAFVEPGTMAVVSTLTLKSGGQDWWFAPGHEPAGSMESR
jgi:hypothetical protein